ncbi:extracellular solute-binding protein [Actinopolymorpha pittospori]|uniref:Multiple sugar transport system substrate-binding protein n=1 Tax=Actinopolymorpha pittospori TaxID=648752 RepID=A0A927MWL5_9ACTN|nr:multiple sugar transport system substrate-binding protein [Actinopolymorpha pittospori]
MPAPNASGRGPTRRRLLGGLGLAGVSTLGLSGCSSYLASALVGHPLPPETVKFWNLFGGGDGVRMQEMLADYRSAHPDVDLRATTFSWGNPYYTKLSLGTLANQPPHVAICHLDRLETPVNTGLLRPFTLDELAEHGIRPALFHQPAWEAAVLGEKIWAVPLDHHPLALYYNTEICEEAGLLDDDGQLRAPTDEESFVEMMLAAKEVTGQWAGAMGINNDIATQYRLFYTLCSQAGGTLVEDDGARITLDREIAHRAVNFQRRLTLEEKVMPSDIDGGGAIALFANRRTAFYIQGGWELTTFLTAKVPFRLTSFPKVFERHVAWDGSHSFVIPRLDGGSDERIQAAMRFIRGMLDRTLTWAKGGHLPAWQSVRSSAEFQALQPHYESLPADGVVYDPRAWYSGSGSNLQVVVGSAVGAAMAGYQSPQAAYQQAREGLQELANTPAPS